MASIRLRRSHTLLENCGDEQFGEDAIHCGDDPEFRQCGSEFLSIIRMAEVRPFERRRSAGIGKRERCMGQAKSGVGLRGGEKRVWLSCRGTQVFLA
jgi:hypothetical protein